MAILIGVDKSGNVVQFQHDEQPVESDAATTAFSALITASGVTTVTASGVVIAGASNTVTAGATQTQAGATALTKGVNVITINATAGNGVALPAVVNGAGLVVINATDKAAQIYGNNVSADTINNIATATGISIAPNSVIRFTATVGGAAGNWMAIAEVPTAAISAGLTAVTAISNQQTPTTGGVTLASQRLAPGCVWRLRAYGTYVAASSSTARNLEVTPYWGSTALTKIASVVLASTAQTTDWTVEFLLTASSTTAVWTTGTLLEQTDVVLSTTAADMDFIIATAASTTGCTQVSTVDLRFDTSASVTGDAINVHSVTIERLI